MSILFKTKQSRAYVLLVIDTILHLFSMIIAGTLRHGLIPFLTGWFQTDSYISSMLLIMIFYAFLYVSQEEKTQDIAEQGAFYSLVDIIKRQSIVLVFILIYLFFMKKGIEVSRIIMVMFTLIDMVLEFLVHEGYKRAIYAFTRNNVSATKVLLVTLSDRVEGIINGMYIKKRNLQTLSAIVLLDRDDYGNNVLGVPVVGNRDNLLMTRRENIYDEVFINIPYDYDIPLESIIMGFEQMGIPVSLSIDVFNLSVEEKQITSMGPYKVISFQPSSRKFLPMLIKRVMDIIGGVVGLFFTGILTLILAPIIKKQSPGPIFYKQTRVGMNGRKFYMYKFRSMYEDADQHKSELQEQNEMQGLMFKMKNDPRVTSIGKFIRRTSLDEFPQFYNVLKGDMSLVGTRPPTEDEFIQYDRHHMRRMSIKPGVTGLWQVSGRNNISNFEDVIRLDFQYIDQWSLVLDIKIILQTIAVMLGKNKPWRNQCCILGVNISVVNMDDTVRFITQNLAKLSGKYICVSNVHTTIMSYEDKDYCSIQNGAAMVLPDGKPLSVVAKKRGCQAVGRVTGPDLMGEIFKISSWNKYRHFFYGSSEETLSMLKKQLEMKYPGMVIAGMISPPYRDLTKEENQEYIQQINQAQADFVWIGLGAPKQERWMAAHKDQIQGVMIGVGAGFDYYAGNIQRAPKWMQKCSLEWLYRLLQDPKKLLKRYYNTNFKFIKLVRKENKSLKKAEKRKDDIKD